MKLFTLLLFAACFLTEGWAFTRPKVPRLSVHGVVVGHPSLPRLYSVSIQDPNDVNDYSDSSSMSKTLTIPEPLLQEQVQSSSADSQSTKAIRWSKLFQNVMIGAVSAMVLYQLLLHQQHHSRGWELSEIAMRDVADDWSAYMRQLNDNPILTKAVTSGTVYTIGDVIAQQTETQESEELTLDGMRVLRSFLAGLIGHGPLSHMWYNVCDFSFENVLHLSAAWWPLKILVDQTVWGPIWNNTYIVLLGLMKRETLETIWSDMKRTTIPLIVSGLKLWPLAHCVTYGLIPNENRLLWVDMVEIVWVTILATQAAGSEGADSKEEAATQSR